MMRRRTLLAGAMLAPFWHQAAANTTTAALESNLLFHYGRELPAQPQRVLAAGPPAAVMLAALVPDRLLGWPQPLASEAHDLLSPVLAAKPVTGRLAGRGSTLGTEALLVLRPDVIVDVGTVDPYYQSQARRVADQTRIPYVLVDGRLAQSSRQLRELGALLGVQARAEQLAAYADGLLLAAAQSRQKLASAGPRFYLARGADGLETGWQGSIHGEVMELLGARNVAEAAPSSGSSGSVGRISIEQLLVWQPDWILTQQAGLAHQLRQQSAWRGIKAVQGGAVLQVPHLPFGWVDGPPSINRLMGLHWLQRLLDQANSLAAFDQAVGASADIRAAAMAFHALFYGTPANASWPAAALP